MIVKTEDYTINAQQLNHVLISGTMRLPSPLSYEKPFSIIKNSLEEATDILTINLKDLEYLNSSGLTSFARIIIEARANNKPLKIIINKSIPWQTKTLLSLNKLWDELSFVLD